MVQHTEDSLFYGHRPNGSSLFSVAAVDTGEHAILFRVDILEVPVHLPDTGVRGLIAHAGPAGGAELSRHRRHLRRDTGLRQVPAGPQGRKVGVEGGKIRHFFSVSRKSLPSGATSTR